jgi:ABC-2 type transport system ATP-binding protein
MIRIKNVTKRYDDVIAINDISSEIEGGKIFGLVGSNGAGKSTLLRLLAGVQKPESGEIFIDDEVIYENTRAKETICFVPDDPYFMPQSNLKDMVRFYSAAYPNWNEERFNKLNTLFRLDMKRKISNFSKGMKRQAAVMLALSTMPKTVLLDEVFDGLDPVMRLALSRILKEDIAERKVTAVVSSHNLRELEDLCDHLGLIHKGGIIFQKDLGEMKLGIHKLQVALNKIPERSDFEGLEIRSFDIRGTIAILVVKGEKESILESINSLNPLVVDILPLTLEEVFIEELEVFGYEIKNIIL